jgi:hypothetical protein
VKKSVARPDDGVHCFFAASSKKVAESLLEKGFLGSLLAMFAPGHRERRFNLPSLLWLGIYAAAHAGLRSMEAILAAACEAVEGMGLLPLRGHTLTESGWSRAKDRLPLGVLKRFWRRWVEVAREQAGTKALYHDMRLVALDKKTFNVPEALWPIFRSHRGSRGEGPAQAELMVAYDVVVRVPLELTLGRVRENERRLAPRLLRKLPCPSLLLIDCGFYSFTLFQDARQAGHHFLTRMSKRGNPKPLELFTPKDGLYEIRGGKRRETMTVRIITTQRRGFRAIRLVTSLLDPEIFPRKEIIELYHERWHIETFFRELKGELDFDHWHTRKLKGLYVELLFTMIYVTVVRAHMAEAVRGKRLLPGHLSFARGAEACMRAWNRIPKSPPETVATLRRELLDLLVTLKIDIRPGRRFERNTQKRRAASRAKKLQALEAKKHAA